MESFDITLCNATVIVTSDSCNEDASKDSSGQYVVDKLKSLNFAQVTKLIVADEKSDITRCVETVLKDTSNVLIITVGGTGLCPRDVTPEATSVFYEKQCTGMVAALHMTSLRYSHFAALSRLTAGINGQCLIVNFPGKLKACKECFSCLEGFLIHGLEQVRFDAEAVTLTHAKQDELQQRQQLEETITSSMNDRDQDANTSVSDNIYLYPLKPETLSLSPPISPESVEIAQGNIFFQDSSKISYCNLQTSPIDPKNINTESPWPLIEYNQALEILGSLSHELYQDKYNLVIPSSLERAHQMLGEVLAEDIQAKTISPPFPVSTMDGYVLNIPLSMRNMLPSITTLHAVLIDSLETFCTMQSDPVESSKFFCYQVNTGGRVPEQNFAIVPFENTGLLSVNHMVPIRDIKLDCYVRAAGSDFDQSNCIRAGTRLGPVELALIQTMGHRQMIMTVQKPIIGFLSTGDELIDPYDSVRDSTKVFDSNLTLLTSLFKSRNHRVVSCGIARDDEENLKTKIISGLGNCDVLLITGGASMGTKDYVKNVIEKIGGTIHFGRVNIKPGKPVAFASIVINNRKKFIFSLPGNPVSAYITSVVLVLPFLEHGIKRHQGSDLPLIPQDVGTLMKVEIVSILDGRSVYKFEDRLEFIRAKSLPQNLCQVEVSIRQQSSRLLSLTGCNCLIMIDPSKKGDHIQIGQTYDAISLTI